MLVGVWSLARAHDRPSILFGGMLLFLGVGVGLEPVGRTRRPLRWAALAAVVVAAGLGVAVLGVNV
ncbi:hypothetical protein GTR02_07355 [Kineococcus sp. R8]|uniref:hypothetical protein n=1 Tax=Kineococcus siccus TaxID=2696567 RepID=UPI0014129B5D|nr:hypothetical protein [Kineococcus siccus]NAZ81633.1 hypothetical protein [Kineococcus siccus]